MKIQGNLPLPAQVNLQKYLRPYPWELGPGDRLKCPVGTLPNYHMYHTYTCFVGTDIVALF